MVEFSKRKILISISNNHFIIKKYRREHSDLNVVVFTLTHSLTELSPSWEAANCAAIQELPSILCNPKVHYRVHKSPPMVPILSQIDPIHTIPFYLSKIYFNIGSTYVLVSPVVSFLLENVI
jgi:hypothetical protein